MVAILRRLVSTLTLLAFVGSIGWPLLTASHVSTDADADCNPGLRAGVHTTTKLDAVQPRSTEHCALCHWLRALSGAAPSAAVSATPRFALRELHVGPTVGRYVHVVQADRPSRAPPADALL